MDEIREQNSAEEIIDIYDDGIPDSVIKFESAQQKKLIRAITEAEVN